MVKVNFDNISKDLWIYIFSFNRILPVITINNWRKLKFNVYDTFKYYNYTNYDIGLLWLFNGIIESLSYFIFINQFCWHSISEVELIMNNSELVLDMDRKRNMIQARIVYFGKSNKIYL